MQVRKESDIASSEDRRWDKGALTGLRGFFAFHVMVYHALTEFTHFPINLYATWDMPLFFLLSGFCLTLAYGKTLWNGSTRCCLGCKSVTSDGVTDLENPAGGKKIFDSWEFYKKRFIRILPLHYLANIAGLIMYQYGYIDFSYCLPILYSHNLDRTLQILITFF